MSFLGSFANIFNKQAVVQAPVVQPKQVSIPSIEGKLAVTNGLKIVIVLDESGSMGSIKDKMRSGVNEFIQGQQNQKADGTTFTLVKFSDNVSTVVDNKPIDEVKTLTENDYIPTGSTALFDAVGLTIERFSEQPKVLMVIVTDGEENASRKYTKKQEITKLIAKYKDEKKWNFVYLSCDVDTFAQGQAMGYAASSQTSNVQVQKSMMSNYMGAQLNAAVSSFRKSGTNVNDTLNSQN
jgi:hypothetical protein